MNSFFDPEKGIWAWLSSLVDVCGLSILWIFLCLPVVTAGPATAALYHAVATCVRPREQGAFGDFFRSLRENLKEGCLASLVCGAAAAVLAFGYGTMRAHTGTAAGGLLFAAYRAALILPAGVLVWLFPLLGRFEFGLKALFATALQLALRHLPTTFVVVLLTAETAVFCLNRWWPVLILPAVVMLLVSLFFEKIFAKYVPELRKETTETEEPEETEE